MRFVYLLFMGVWFGFAALAGYYQWERNPAMDYIIMGTLVLTMYKIEEAKEVPK